MKGNEGFSPLFQDDPYGVAAEPAPERPIGDHPSALEHHDAVAGSLDFGEQVGVEEDRGARGLALFHKPADIGPARWVECRGWFVEK